MKGIILFIFFLLPVGFNLLAQISFQNPSFEGKPRLGQPPPFWVTCTITPDTEPLKDDPPQYIDAFNGSTYVGLGFQRPHNPESESISQELQCNLIPYKVHNMSLALYTVNLWFFHPGKCQIWGGFFACNRTELLWESPDLDSTWKKYEVSFTPTKPFNYILFTSFICDSCGNQNSGGYLGIDNLSDIQVDNYNFLSTNFSDTIVNQNKCVTLKAYSDDTSAIFQWSSIPQGVNGTGDSITDCPDGNTKYICTATYICGYKRSDTVSVKILSTSVKYLSEQMATMIYPNPTEGLLVINHPKEDVIIDISDVSGRVLLINKSSNRVMDKIDLSGLANGIYFCSVKRVGNPSLFQKIILEK